MITHRTMHIRITPLSSLAALTLWALVVSLPSLGADREAKGAACCPAPDLAREVHPDTTTAPRVKRAPEFLRELPNQTIFVDEQFEFVYQARDNERGRLNCEKEQIPPRASLRRDRKGNRTDCVFRWRPREFGQYTIIVAVRNTRTGEQIETSAVLTVTFQNAPPRFTNTLQETTIQAGETLRHPYSAEDPNVSEGDVLTFALINPPQGATIDPQTGAFSWSSPTTMSGQQVIEVEVRDKAGARATTNTRVHFEGVVAGPPQFTRTLPSETTLEVGQRLDFTFEAEDANEGTLTFDMRRQPRGLQFNPGTGAFSWTPTDSQVGAHDIIVIVRNVAGLQSETRTRILVEPKEPEVTNLNPPRLINLDRQKHTDAGKPLRFTVEAEDDDGDALTYSLVNPPRGAAIDPQSGQFRWTPAFGQAGRHEIPVHVSDGKFSDEGIIRVEVSKVEIPEGETNLGPYFVKVPPAELEHRVGETVAFSYETIDPNPGDVLSYRLVAGPSSAVIDEATGEFRWVPGEAEIGAHRIVVEVRDEAGETDEVSTRLNVLPAEGPPPVGPTIIDRLGGAPWWMYLGGGLLLLGLILGLVFLRRTSLVPKAVAEGTYNVVAFGNRTLTLGNAQHIGQRNEQQDAFGFSNPMDVDFVATHGMLAIVADGMGGMDLGREAGLVAVQAFLNAYENTPPDESIPEALHQSLLHANKAVLSLATTTRLDDRVGTTLIAAVVRNDQLFWISVGDSRIYWYRHGRLTQLTTDHIYAEQLKVQVQQGVMAQAAADNHPERFALTSYLGLDELTEIDWNDSPTIVRPGDRIMLCSDGLFSTLSVQEIAETVKKDPQATCDALVRRALAKQRQRQDNITVVIMAYE